MAEENMGAALGWDDEVTVEDSDFKPIPEGDYAFEVVSVERGQFAGSAKLVACPEAIVTIRLNVAGQSRQLTERIKLNNKLTWIIDQYFKSIGLRDEDATSAEPLKMQWSRSIGLQGAAHVTAEEYNGKTYNHVGTWLKPSEAVNKGVFAPAVPAAPVAPAAAAYGQGF